MKIKKWLRQTQFRVKLEFKLQDFFIGFYWKTQKNIYGFIHLDLWILLFPTVPIHIHCLIGRDHTEVNLETNIFWKEHRRMTQTIPKITKLFYDSSGRAYPPMPSVKSNWDKTYEYEGKYYKLVGDNEHKEWSQVQKKRGINSVDLKKENYEY